jgi:hypothetical protein
VDNKAAIEELQRKIFQVCAVCPHAKWATGRFECDRKRSQCHSVRVRRWLGEIKKLEVSSNDRGQGNEHKGLED